MVIIESRRPVGGPSPLDSLADELAFVDKELADLDGRRRRYTDGYGRGIFTDERFIEATRDLDEEERVLRQRKDRLTQEVEDAEAAAADLRSRPERLQVLLALNTTPQEKKAVLHTLVRSVTVYYRNPIPLIS